MYKNLVALTIVFFKISNIIEQNVYLLIYLFYIMKNALLDFLEFSKFFGKITLI